MLEYTPELDGDADPGEVVWGWVAYEDDPAQGKDRPVLIVGHDQAAVGHDQAAVGHDQAAVGHDRAAVGHDQAAAGQDVVLALMLSSQDYHEGDPAWLPLGSGAWDGEGRPSWVRLDRVLEMPADAIRREGAILDRERFDRVAAALRSGFGWS